MERNHLFFSLLLILLLVACQETNDAGLEDAQDEESIVLPPAGPFEKRLTYSEYQLVAKTTKVGQQTSLAIRGLVGENPLSTSINCKVERVADVEITDLNEDGQPEVFVFDHSDDGHFFGHITAFQLEPKATWSEIPVEELPVDLRKGYRGNDQFRIEGRKVARTFPVYRENGKKTGKTQTVEYALARESTGFQLRISN